MELLVWHFIRFGSAISLSLYFILEFSRYYSMSFQARNDRRDRSRFPVQSNHQEWVPRGSTATIVNQPSSRNTNQNGLGADSNCSSGPPDSRHSGNFALRGHSNRHVNQKPRKEMDSHEDRVSNLPQLVQELQEKLSKGAVECMICYDMIRRFAPIWSCSGCYSIFHLSCIKKWARAPTSTDLSAEKNQGFNWRCPGCQAVQLTTSKEIRYICFCGKRPDPPSDLYLTPHSCGEPCGQPLGKEVPGSVDTMEVNSCPHKCVLQCHPGPCPPCKAFAPPRLCPCGKKTVTTRCSERKSVLTCGQRCDKFLDCERHQCEKICHVGHCDPCCVLLDASCFCQKKMEVVLCGDIAMKGKVRLEDGIFSCNLICGKNLGCANHFCSEVCHPGPCGDCVLTPNKIKTCYCGKTLLQDKRNSCVDPIPTCNHICDKTLPCGIHHCKELCHAGDCSPCSALVSQKCRCGSTSRTVECYKTMSETEKFTCDKPCGRKKNCGRHRCSERCCPLSNPNNNLSTDWDPHFCSMPCGKKLRCGQHFCESLCHSGHCPQCLETIFTDLTCSCGRTSIPPPLPCGTPPPSCQHPCSVPQPCGHPPSHSCHFGDCPPCAIPIAKECCGGHVVLRNIPCGSKDIRCNKLCGKTRHCGMHACARTCHPPPCDSSSSSSPSPSTVSARGSSCGQTCGAPRRDCRHTCTAACHPSSPCPDTRCNVSVVISCSCGRITTTVPCDAGGCNGGGFSVDSVYEASVIQKLPVPLQPIEVGDRKKVPLGQRKLMCNEECAKMERKRVLADAFDITPPSLDSLHLSENTFGSELLSDLFRRDSKWVMAVEDRFKFLVLGKSRGGSGTGTTSTSALRVHVFSPMVKEKRDAIRLMAERWKLSVNAVGWEPKRFIVVHVTPKSKVPVRVIGTKGSTPINPLPFDPLVDMDPRLVVALLDLPRDADISALVLRFGGECELVWLNDKNALAVFGDPARAATAMRRLDHGSVYHGAAIFHQNGGASSASSTAGNAWGGGASLKVASNPWKKAVENSWAGGSVDLQGSVWKEQEAPIAASVNRWSVLDDEVSGSGSGVTVDNPVSGHEVKASGVGDIGSEESSEVVDDWEKAYE